MRSIGILSGSFDPIHFGHIRLANSLARLIPLDEVLLVPLSVPGHRKPAASLAHRRRMMQLATENHPKLIIPDFRFKQESPSVYDIVRAVKNAYRDAVIYYIIGADRLPGMQYWQNAAEIFTLCEFLVCPRPGYNLSQLADFAASYGAKIHLMRFAEALTSAELVRKQLALYNDAPDMLDPAVIHHIARNGLYMPDYETLLKPMLNASRLQHTLSVRQTAVDLAVIHQIPLLKTSAAAMLHDCAKCMPLTALRQIAIKNRLTDDKEMLSSAALLHGIVGAYIARERFGIQDEDILNAIANHTIGRSGMSPLELCIFVADAIEPLRRPYAELEEIRALSQVDLRAAALLCFQSTKRHISRTGGHYSIKSQMAMDSLAYQISQ